MQALVIGSFEPHERQVLRFAGGRAGTTLDFHELIETAMEPLTRTVVDVGCILVSSEECGRVCSWVREDARVFTVPIVALVAHASDATFRRAYNDGADDAMLRGDLGGITRRLANLKDRPIDTKPPATQGLAVIAFPDNPRRRVLGRTLRTAGFDVAYAATSDELFHVARGMTTPALIVTHRLLPGAGGPGAIDTVRKLVSKPKLPALLLPALPEEQVEVDLVEAADETGRLLFFAEEALRGDVSDLRASKRLLYNGLCAFREAGSLDPVFGLTHNISNQGLYVRTLDPPRPGSEVWFEMRVPGDMHSLVHLRGQVMWRREARHMGGAAPAGFGMRITEPTCPPQDLSLYSESYEELGGHFREPH